MRIEETGRWNTEVLTTSESWVINTSDILTKLIFFAGRYCEMYASDLFIIWDCNVQRKLKERGLESFDLLLGFRQSGVDTNDTVLKNKEQNPYYYRKVCNLSVVVDGTSITMTLDY